MCFFTQLPLQGPNCRHTSLHLYAHMLLYCCYLCFAYLLFPIFLHFLKKCSPPSVGSMILRKAVPFVHPQTALWGPCCTHCAPLAGLFPANNIASGCSGVHIFILGPWKTLKFALLLSYLPALSHETIFFN